jgi:Protein of unknown function (DUF4038)/Putative collagen-binding domain of a collagenase
MSATPRNRQDLRAHLLLTAALLILVLLSALHFGHRLRAAHDPGFSMPHASAAATDSRDGAGFTVSAEGQFITLDPTGKYLINSITKEPVFITGDSAWTLITQLDDSDVEVYLSDRASRGFNYIWCGAADNFYQSNAPKNYYGASPFDGPDFTHEDVKYWAHVDHVLQRAAAYGITVALDPAFVGLAPPGGYLTSYQRSSGEVLTDYGAFLGDRYEDFPNVIWALGGDVPPESGVVPKLTALAHGIRSKDSVHLIVAEGQPQHAALDTFAGTTWMDLNWLYFHTTNIPSGVASNFSRSPWLPPIQGEAWYEDRVTMTPLQFREQGYWAVLSGSYLGNAGFGNAPLWYFNGVASAQASDPTWQSQLGSAGSTGQMYLGRLFRSREHWKLVPDINHSVMTAGYDSRSSLDSIWESLRSLIYQKPYRLGSNSAVAARTSDGQSILVYVPSGSDATVTVDLSKIADPTSQAEGWWFDPRNGSSSPIGTVATWGTRQFTAPDRNDWVLIIDSRDAHLPPPGSADLCEKRVCH